MKPRLLAAVLLPALWLAALFVFLQHTEPVISSSNGHAFAAPLDVVINEVAWGGTATYSGGEWMELKNNTAFPITMTGWTLTSTSGISMVLVGVIPAHGYFLLERINDSVIIDITADQFFSYGLNDPPTPDRLVLRDNAGAIIDTANDDGGPWPAGSAGLTYYSMERVDPLALDADGNWASNDGVIRNGHDVGGIPINGTPKLPNSATSANLGIAQSAPSLVLMDQAVHYMLVFSNTGRLNVTNAIITDTVPLSVTFANQTSPYTFTQAGQELVWQVGTLLTSTGNVSLTFVVTPDVGFAGWLTNTAVITSEVADYRPDNNVITATTLVRPPVADLEIHKDGPPNVTAGYEFTYTITFSNTGETDAANVVVTDTLPVSVTFVRSTEPYSLSQPASGTLLWQAGSVPVGGSPINLTAVVTTPPGTSGWLTNQVTITTVTTEISTTNNTAIATTQVTPQFADISIAKSAPASATAGGEITYVITISNLGQLDAQDVRVTDTLPISVTFLRQSAPYVFRLDGRVLAWNVGDVPASASPVSWTVTGLVDLNLSGVTTNAVQACTVTDESVTANNSAQAATLVTPPPPVVLINGVLYDGYQLNDTDEAVEIINVGLTPVNLRGYTVTEGTLRGVQFPDYTLQVNQRAWVARDAQAFFNSFGFWPDFAVASTITGSVLPLAGSWPGGSLGPSGDVQVESSAGIVLDRLVYGGQALPVNGWSGPTVYPYNVGGAEGQILARVPDEHTGLPVQDTDTAADWMQYTDNYTAGRRVLYPGWDMTYPALDVAGFFWPFTTTTPATVTLGIAPDNAYEVVRDAIRSAQRTLEIEAYELMHYGIITEVVQKARTGVSVTVLLEGAPAGGMQDQERWACQEIEATGGQCWFMRDDVGARIHSRYRHVHAKFILLDRQRILITTENFSGGGLPDDNKSDGTYGSRGYVLYIESPKLAARAGLVFERDRDPIHADIARWGTSVFTGPAAGFVPITVTGGTTTTVRFPLPRVITDATSFELFTSPEASLRQSDALLGLLARAGTGDEVYVEQMYEYPDWGDVGSAPNLRLKAYLDAARRGARVRVLLNAGQFEEGYLDLTKNITATAYINSIARQEGLDLQARMGDPTYYGVHSKLVLVRFNNLKVASGTGLAYSHVSSINGSEESSKINREIAVQVESAGLYAELSRVFWVDWNLSGRVFLPFVMRAYPIADHTLISEVLYDPVGVDTGKEWVELYNLTGRPIDLSGWSLGDALTDGEYGAGRYVFPNGTVLGSSGVIVIAQQAISVTFKPNLEFVIEPNLDDPNVPNMTPAGSWPGFGFSLGNAGDKAILQDAAGNMVDAVAWGTASVSGVVSHPGVANVGGHSLERYPAYRDTDDCTVDFRDQPSPAPGWVSQ